VPEGGQFVSVGGPSGAASKPSWAKASTSPVLKRSVQDPKTGKGKIVPGGKPGSQLPMHVQGQLKAAGVTKFPAAHIADVQVSSRLGGPDQDKGVLLKWTDDRGHDQSAYTKAFEARQAEAKWERVQQNEPKVEAAIDGLREQATTSPAHAAALLIAQTGLRPGSDKSVNELTHHGATTILAQHVRIEDGVAQLEFVGKEGKTNRSIVHDPVLVSVLQRATEGRAPGERVFPGLSPARVAEVLPSGVKVKDLRTIAATRLARELLGAAKPSLTGNAKVDARHVMGLLKAVSERVSIKLNNTPAMARKSYIHPEVVRGWATEHGLGALLKWP